MATAMIPDAGELNQMVRLMAVRPLAGDRCCQRPRPQEAQDGLKEAEGWRWEEYRKAWAKATPTNGLAIYANSGVGSREAEMVIRKQQFDLDNAILWKGQFCLPTSITPLGPRHLTVKVALVTPKICKGIERGSNREIQFPAVVTEKYMGHSQEEPMAQNMVRLVLVTPTVVKLKLGSLVTAGDDSAPYWVKIVHEMDHYKHEVEIEKIVEH